MHRGILSPWPHCGDERRDNRGMVQLMPLTHEECNINKREIMEITFENISYSCWCFNCSDAKTKMAKQQVNILNILINYSLGVAEELDSIFVL